MFGPGIAPTITVSSHSELRLSVPPHGGYRTVHDTTPGEMPPSVAPVRGSEITQDVSESEQSWRKERARFNCWEVFSGDGSSGSTTFSSNGGAYNFDVTNCESQQTTATISAYCHDNARLLCGDV